MTAIPRAVPIERPEMTGLHADFCVPLSRCSEGATVRSRLLAPPIANPRSPLHGACGTVLVLEEIALALGVPSARLLKDVPRKRARR